MATNPQPTQVSRNPSLNQAHADRQVKQMFNGVEFQAGGQGVGRGNPFVRMNTWIYLDGLGHLWSAKYSVWATTHTVGESGYTVEFTCQADSFIGDAHAALDAFKAMQAQEKNVQEHFNQTDGPSAPVEQDAPPGQDDVGSTGG